MFQHTEMYLNATEDGLHKIDHLESSDEINWCHPRIDDSQIVRDVQILPIEIKGVWDFRKRAPTFKINNRDAIENMFKDYKV